ncbi:hypothetical protein BRIN106911_16485 [Brevibacillus invocatus]
MSLFVNNVLKRDTPEGKMQDCERILWIDRAAPDLGYSILFNRCFIGIFL